jgi:hypothetical protein
MRFSMKTKIIRFQLAALLPISLLSMFMAIPTARAASFPNAGFEDGTFTGWEKGSQSGTLGSTITGNGTGVTIFTGSGHLPIVNMEQWAALQNKMGQRTHITLQRYLLEVGHLGQTMQQKQSPCNRWDKLHSLTQ